MIQTLFSIGRCSISSKKCHGFRLIFEGKIEEKVFPSGIRSQVLRIKNPMFYHVHCIG